MFGKRAADASPHKLVITEQAIIDQFFREHTFLYVTFETFELRICRDLLFLKKLSSDEVFAICCFV